jgi:phage terminase small subunit
MPSTKTRIQKTKPKKVKDLTDKQILFVHEYLASDEFSAVAAAKKVGYRSPYSAAGKLMSNPVVTAYLGHLIKKRIDRTDITAERVLKELGCIGFSDPRKLFDSEGVMIPIKELSEETARAISSIEVKSTETEDGMISTTAKIKLWSKNNALELIAKHLGMLLEQKVIKHEVGPDFLASLLDRVESTNNIIDVEVLSIEEKK